MNQKLTEEIVYHILANLGVLPSSFVDQDVTKSVIDKRFLLSDKLSFETEEGDLIHKNVYGCQIQVGGKDLKLLLADCGTSKDLPEYCLLTQLKDAPTFGMFLVYSQLSDDGFDPEAMIAVSVDTRYWVPCSTYLQATYLAGMEQLRDLGFGWTKCTAYQAQYAQLQSFIKFHNNFYGVNHEGQEDGS
jgi:hypothetical protein